MGGPGEQHYNMQNALGGIAQLGNLAALANLAQVPWACIISGFPSVKKRVLVALSPQQVCRKEVSCNAS